MAEKRPLPIVTILFAAANVAVFIWEIAAGADPVTPTAQWMSEHGGNFGPITLHGEPWRLLTSMFLHYGVIHIAMNMVGLVGGRHVEKMYGKAGFAALYLVAGVAGGLASALRGNAVSAGASGAIFGVFGAFGAFLLVHRARLDAEQVQKQARGLMIFLAFNIYYGVTTAGIDLVAHLGGLVAGFVAGIALELGTREDRSVRRSLIVGVVGCGLVLGATFVVPKPNNAYGDLATAETKVIDRWNGLVPQIKSGALSGVQSADIIDHELLPQWEAARAKFEHDGDGPHRDDMIEYLAARQDGWAMISKALRTGDLEGVSAGMTRFEQGDAVFERIKDKP